MYITYTSETHIIGNGKCLNKSHLPETYKNKDKTKVDILAFIAIKIISDVTSWAFITISYVNIMFDIKFRACLMVSS